MLQRERTRLSVCARMRVRARWQLCKPLRCLKVRCPQKRVCSYKLCVLCIHRCVCPIYGACMRANLLYTTGRGWAIILDMMVLVYVCVLVCVCVCVWGCIYDCHERLFSLEVRVRVHVRVRAHVRVRVSVCARVHLHLHLRLHARCVRVCT